MNNSNEPNLKIILDSTSGYSKLALEKNNFAFIPQKVIIDDQEFFDGDNIDLKKLIELQKGANKVQTSQPSYGQLLETIEHFSKSNKYVIFIPMNKGISSTYDVAAKASENFENVAVIPNSLFGTAMVDAATRAKEAFDKTHKIQDAINAIQYVNENALCYIAPKNLDAFIKGGRLKGGKRFILEKAHLIPRLLIRDEGIKVTGIKRNVSKLIISIVERIINKIGKDNINDYHWEIIHTYDTGMNKIAEQTLKSVGVKEILKIPAATIIGIHTGIGALAINVWPKN